VTQSGAGASTILGGGKLSVPNDKAFKLDGGTFIGDTGLAGAFTGNLENNGGTVIVGSVAARKVFKVVGNYTQAAGGTLQVVGTDAATFGKLSVTGNATINGTLEVVLAAGFNPAAGTVDVEIFGCTGAFAQNLVASLPAGFNITIDAVNKKIVLKN